VTATVADLLVLTMDAGAPTGERPATAEPFDTPEHRALVDAARAGSCEAFGALVALHQRVVFRAALAALGRREDAEDAAQEAFVVAWQKLAGFRGDSSFRTWLLTIAWRKALDRRRGRLIWWRRSARAAADDAFDEIDSTPGTVPDPERAAIAGDLARQVRLEIARLSPKLRDTLLLAAAGEHSYQEIAAMLGVPLGTVKWRVAEARRVLAARLVDRPPHAGETAP
jgi:RNA polymerase sigma-70 factor (ECF subfamily)